MSEKLKTAIIIVLVGLLAFALGRLSALQGGGELKIEYSNATQGAAAASFQVSGSSYVASKTGSKYFLPWCGGAQTIKEENKVYFASAAAAEASGYFPAANCKGL